MLQTKVKEQHEIKGGKISTDKLFIDASNIMFSIENGTILAYVKKGYILEKTEVIESIDPADENAVITTNVITEHKRTVAVSKLKYSELEVKALFDANGIVFNGAGDNLLLTALHSAADLIAMYTVSSDPNTNFGLTIDKWEIV